MMRNQRSLRNEIRVQAAACPTGRGGGAVIIVVVSLMTTLLFLGLFFYSWTSQERATAEFYGNTDPLEVDPDPIFDFGLQQVISHTESSRQNSALYGSRWSMLSHVIGTMNADGTPTDLIPYNGNGISVRIDPSLITSTWRTSNDANKDGHVDITTAPTTMSKTFWFDYLGNNSYSAATQAELLLMNFSLRANGGTDYTSNTSFQFSPDAGYTYPDVNSLFLSYEDSASGVTIPSYFRPQYLPGMRGSQNGFNNLYTDSNYAAMVLRPHQSHAYVAAGSLTAGDNANRRFLVTAQAAKSGDQSRVLAAFPFNVDVDNDGNSNECGILSSPPSVGSTSRTLEFDADADGDGIRDSIYMDLDHPIVDLPGGRQVMPLFYFKVVDADGLLNVNTHGNLNLNRTVAGSSYPDSGYGYSHPYGNDTSSGNIRSIHTSNLGLSSTEINPTYALFSDPNNSSYLSSSDQDLALKVHGSIFGFTPSSYYTTASARNRMAATANMELAMLLKGHTDPYGGSPYLGRWSTGAGTETVAFTTMAGTTSTDDDSDYQRGGRFRTDTYLNPLVQPPFVHPLDYIGQAQYPHATTYNEPRRSLGGTPTTGSPAVWPNYDPKWQETDETLSANYSGVHSLRASSTALQSNADSTALTDEPDEIVIEPGQRNYAKDRPFEPGEMAALHLSNTSWASASQHSRLRNLAPMNFEYSRQAEAIRRQFTTDSWDRKELCYPASFNRQWEFTDNGTARFPPSFGSITSRHERISSSNNAAAATSIVDPFRPVIRRLLTVPIAQEVANTAGLTFDSTPAKNNFNSQQKLPQQKLNINRLLVNFDRAGNPIYRELTPHSAFTSADTDTNSYLFNSGAIRPVQHDHLTTYDGSTPITTNYYDTSDALNHLEPNIPAAAGGFAACPFSAASSDKFAQEVWARYDRQRLARDIYVLLYTTAWGGSTFNPTTTTPSYTNLNPLNLGFVDVDSDGYVDAVREMAQFAVNYVDALDRDNTITRFDYDPNLTDGWQAGSTETVYGVEGETLSFSEVLMLLVPRNSTDRARTLVEEENDADHEFLYVELRNSSPFTINLRDDSWRIVRVLHNGSAADTVAEVEIRGSPRSAGGAIGPGENFYISCHDGSAKYGGGGVPMPSDFYVDFQNGSELECAIPKANTSAVVSSNSSAPPRPLADLDLSWSDATYPHQNFYTFTKRIAGGTTTLVQPGGSMTPATPVQFDLVLQRKRNLQQAAFSADTEWVEIDRFFVDTGDWQSFSPATDSQADVATALSSVNSMERRQPLDGRKTSSTAPPPQQHTFSTSDVTYYVSAATVHQKNASLPTSQFTLFQPHFDRDFASPIDLLSVPLYGPPTLASAAAYNLQIHGSTPQRFSRLGLATGHWTAAIRFLNPQQTYPTTPTDYYTNGGDINNNSPANYQNTWYRLLNFISAEPNQNQFGEQNFAQSRRDPGKLNLNMLRHESVMAGLIDDRVHLDPFGRFANSTPYPMTWDVLDASPFTGATQSYPYYPNVNRVWHQQLLIARDGLDPVLTNLSATQNSNIPVPGLPGSSPFRPAANVDPAAAAADDAIDNGLLREAPGVRTTLNERGFGIFDARTVDDFEGSNFTVDYHTARRLLAKVANQTTTRSHVFVIHAGYDLFEAHQPTGSTVQIGGKADDLPGRRMFLVVDMSRLEEAYYDSDPSDSVPGTFDFRKFIIHRQLLP
ncbi:hypothetical protein [Planctomicrobium piriforme]|uniref:Uncharacterized protein n=1 Tax=Planctomicrobium piriforme TaxID=1576369 RepID=A0A1I3RZE4_9PLAN|nr:hypothetical protein [Planctomicrobium piriforme]SFJ50689.1 hypothetical protein SAMN05421753_12224 [Planctomicrobium piriforme]